MQRTAFLTFLHEKYTFFTIHLPFCAIFIVLFCAKKEPCNKGSFSHSQIEAGDFLDLVKILISF